MSNHPRSRRVPILGARVRLSSTVADLINVSRSGALIRANAGLRVGSEWSVVLELPTVFVRLIGRVVRHEWVDVPLPGGAALQRQQALGFKFVNPPTEARSVLEEVCGTAMDAGDR